MRARAFLHIVVFTGIFIWMLVLLAACSSPGEAIPQSVSSPQFQGAPEELPDALVDAGAPNPVSTEPAASLAESLPTGTSLLERRCVQCHLIQSLEQTDKSRAEWEQTLAKMETFGVVLEAGEKTALLDDLAGPDEP